MPDATPPQPDLRSPLRYPGGKAFLCEYVERFLLQNSLRPRRFVEPFAGGASVALYLLGRNLVDSIALYDKDPLVASFWEAAFGDNQWIRGRVSAAAISLREWERQHAKFVDGTRSNAWKCLFLNRTSFSGIITPRAGPLGGKTQRSRYKIDCRFYRRTLNARLEQLASWADRVAETGALDWSESIDRVERLPTADRNSFLFYLDPPFFHKAERLYNFYFEQSDHEALASRLSRLQIPWLLSYDDCPEVLSIFRRHDLRYRRVPVRYTSATQRNRIEKWELIASNLPLPRQMPL